MSAPLRAPEAPGGDEGLRLSDLAAARDVLLRAPLRMAGIALVVAAAFVAWTMNTAPAYRATVKVRVEDVAEKSPQLERRQVPAGVTTAGEALTLLRSRTLAREVVAEPVDGADEPWRLGLTTWITDEGAAPLRRFLRGLVAPVHGDFVLGARARRTTEDAPRAVRLRFVEHGHAVELTEDLGAASMPWGPGAARFPWAPGDALAYRGLELELTVRGRPDGRTWRIESLTEDQAAERVLARLAVDEQQHQPGTLGLTVVDDRAERAAALADALAAAFVARDEAATRERAEGKALYLAAELVERRARLAEVVDRRAALLASSPDLVAGDAAAAELAEREGQWDDVHRRTRGERLAAERALQRLRAGEGVEAALSTSTVPMPPELRALLDARAADRARLAAVGRGSEDAGYRRALLLKADDYRLEAQRFETRAQDLSDVIAGLERGEAAVLSRLGGDLAREGSIAVDRNVRLWIDGYEAARTDLETLAREFKEGYGPLEAARALVEYYRGRILEGLVQVRAGLEASLTQKRAYARYWEELHDAYPDAEAALVQASVAQLEREIAAAVGAWAEGLRVAEEHALAEHARLVARLARMATDGRELARLAPEEEGLELVVGELLRDVEHARIAAAGIEASARVIDPAVAPRDPFKPRLGFALVAGMVLGSMVACLWSWLLLGPPAGPAREPIPAVDGTGRAGAAPLLARIPVRGPAQGAPRPHLFLGERRAHDRAWLALLEDPDGPGADAVRTLRTRLAETLVPLDGVAPLLGVVAAAADEGATAVALQLAASRAHLGDRVLLVDLAGDAEDLLRAAGVTPGETWRAQLRDRHPVDVTPDEAGLLQVLDGTRPWADAVRPAGVATLDLLPRGRSAVPLADLVAGAALPRAFAHARATYDLVVIALPALSAGPAAESTLPCTSGVLLVEGSASDLAPSERAWALRALDATTTPLLGRVHTTTDERCHRSRALAA